MGNLKKKSGENKNKLRTIYPRNQEYFKKAGVGSDLTGSYKKKCIDVRFKKRGDLTIFSKSSTLFFLYEQKPWFS